MRTVVLLVLAAATASYGLVTGLRIEPVKAAWSGKVEPNPLTGGIWQSITCNFDEPIYAEFFTGTATNQQYQVQLQFPSVGGLVVAHGDAVEPRELRGHDT